MGTPRSIRTGIVRLGTVAAVALGGGQATAQSEVATETDIGEVVVGAGRTPVALNRLGRATTVVTAEEIEERQIRFATDALRNVPGVSVSRTGAVGGATEVRIRGAEANHVLVLIDGVEVSSPAGGEFDFGGLLAADIERIEVLRGPQSALFGSNATAGIINIVTKTARAPGLSIGGSAEGGTDETAAADAFVRGSNERIDLSLSTAFRRSGGHDVSGDATDIEDRDENFTLNARMALRPVEDVELDGSLRLTTRESDFDGFNFGAADRAGLVTEEDNVNDQREIFASFGGRTDLFGGRVASRARVDYTDVETINRTDGAATSDNTGTRLKTTLQSTVALDAPTVSGADHTFTVAGEFERETFENNDAALVFDPSQLDKQARNLYGFVGEYQGSFFDALDVQAAVRHDVNDDFDDATTYSASVSYIFESTGTRPHASVGTGVTNPTFFEQFGFIPDTFIGNSDLRPEESFGWDVGVEQSFLNDRFVIDVTYFRADLEDEIFTVFGPAPDFLATPANQDGTSERQGVEVALAATPIPSLNLTASYTFTDADDPDGLVEVRRPKHEVGFAASYRFLAGDALVGFDGRYVVGNTDFDFTAPAFGSPNRVELDDYVLVNVFGSYAVTENFSLQARVDNVLDTNYQEVDGFETPGIAGYLGGRVQF